MKESGALLKEVGTTNKTKLSDYENAIDENTKMLMKVHKSNFSIEGFSEEVSFEAYKPSLISFSGDKLFGSVQAGIIAGKKEFIDKLKENQLLRMLRVDKITLSILEETIKAYLLQDYEQIPTLKLLFQSIDSLEKRVLKIQSSLEKGVCDIINT